MRSTGHRAFQLSLLGGPNRSKMTKQGSPAPKRNAFEAIPPNPLFHGEIMSNPYVQSLPNLVVLLCFIVEP